MVKISELSSLSTPASNDELAIVDVSTGETKKIAVSDLAGAQELIDINITGASATATGTDAIAIGDATASNTQSIAIGHTATVSADDAIQLGDGSNSTANTLQYQGVTVSNDFSIQVTTGSGAPTATVADGSLFIDTANDDIYYRTGGSWEQANGSQSPLTSKGDVLTHNGTNDIRIPVGTDGQILVANSAVAAGIEWITNPGADEYIKVNGSVPSVAGSAEQIAIGSDAQALSSIRNIAIGALSLASSSQSLAVGYNSESSGNYATSFGANAQATANSAGAWGGGVNTANSANADAVGAFQIGNGTNSTANTLQFEDVTIANDEGIQAFADTGAPTGTPADGTLYVDTTSDEFYFRSGGTWVSPAGGTGDPFFVSGYGGGDPLPTAGTGTIAVGAGANGNGDQSIAIGENASTTSARGVALGANTTAAANAGAWGGGVSFGTAARATASGAFQIGNGVNSTANTLQFEDFTIANAQSGLQANTVTSGPSLAAPDGSLAVNTSTNEFFFRSSSAWQTVGGESYVDINSGGADPLPNASGTDAVAIGAQTVASSSETVAIGEGAVAQQLRAVALGFNTLSAGNASVAIGAFADAGAPESIAIGDNSDVGTGANRSVAIGDSAIVSASTSEAIQLGAGTNNNNQTLQFRSETIANNTSIQAATQSTGAAPTSSPADGTIIVDTSGTGTLYVRAGGSWRSVALT